MFVTKKALPRRTFLRGVGTTMALPLLESMVPALTALAQTPAKPPLRFGAVYFPNGATKKHWFPDATSPGYEYKTILKPLEPFRNHVTSFGNLSRAGGKTVTDHAVSSAGWLTGAVAKQTEAEDIRVGVSIDQVIAKQIGQDTQLPSMEVATEDFSGYVGGCVPGYSCAYMNSISWASETQSNPMETNPRAAFERMFGRSGTQAERLQRIQEDRSILDSVTEEARDLQRKVGARDRARLGDYLDNVREIERRIQRTEAQNSKKVIALDAPLGVPDNFVDHANLMFDLLAVAYQSDLTRVFSFMMSREASQRTYPELNIPRHAPRRLAPRRPSREHGEAREDQPPLRAAVRALRREAQGDARRRRHRPRQLADLLRRRHERRSGARAVSASARRGRAAAEARSKAIGTSSHPTGRRSRICGSGGRCLRHPSRLLCREHRPGRSLTLRI